MDLRKRITEEITEVKYNQFLVFGTFGRKRDWNDF